MPWEKPSPSLIARFDAWLPADTRVERRKMFGCPCAFVNRNMFAGVYQQSIVLRLPESRRAALLEQEIAQLFSVARRTMREYVMVVNALACDEAKLRALIAEALQFAGSLPVKQRAKKREPIKRTAGKQPRAKSRLRTS